MDIAALLSAVNPLKLSPIRATILDDYDQGVVYRLGKGSDNLFGPKFIIHAGWGITRVESMTRREFPISVKAQCVYTEDNIAAHVATSMVVSVFNYKMLLSKCDEDEYEEQLIERVSDLIASAVRHLSFADLVDDRAWLQEKIMEDLQAYCEERGVRVHEVFITDAVPARYIRLLGD